MKKVLITLAVVIGLGFLASQVFAWGPWGHGTGYGNHGYRGTMNMHGASNDAIRQQLNAKIAEYDAVVSQANPDPDRAKKLSAEIAELRNQLRTGGQNYNYQSNRGYHMGGPYCGWNHGYCW